MTTVFKQIRIEHDLLEKAKEVAKHEGLSVSAFIRVAIIEKVRRCEK